MDSFSDLIGPVASGVWHWRRRQPDSSLAGRSSDRFDNQPGLRATHDLSG